MCSVQVPFFSNTLQSTVGWIWGCWTCGCGELTEQGMRVEKGWITCLVSWITSTISRQGLVQVWLLDTSPCLCAAFSCQGLCCMRAFIFHLAWPIMHTDTHRVPLIVLDGGFKMSSWEGSLPSRISWLLPLQAVVLEGQRLCRTDISVITWELILGTSLYKHSIHSLPLSLKQKILGS